MVYLNQTSVTPTIETMPNACCEENFEQQQQQQPQSQQSQQSQPYQQQQDDQEESMSHQHISPLSTSLSTTPIPSELKRVHFESESDHIALSDLTPYSCQSSGYCQGHHYYHVTSALTTTGRNDIDSACFIEVDPSLLRPATVNEVNSQLNQRQGSDDSDHQQQCHLHHSHAHQHPHHHHHHQHPITYVPQNNNKHITVNPLEECQYHSHSCDEIHHHQHRPHVHLHSRDCESTDQANIQQTELTASASAATETDDPTSSSPGSFTLLPENQFDINQHQQHQQQQQQQHHHLHPTTVHHHPHMIANQHLIAHQQQQQLQKVEQCNQCCQCKVFDGREAGLIEIEANCLLCQSSSPSSPLTLDKQNHQYHCPATTVNSLGRRSGVKLPGNYPIQERLIAGKRRQTPCNSDLRHSKVGPMANDQQSFDGYSYLPIFIIATVLTVSTVLLVVASVFYIKYLPFQKTSTIHEGSCNCAFGGHCSSLETSEPICLCDTFKCDASDTDPVCATDNKTYSNECQLNLTSCNLQTPLTVQYKGTCNNTKSACDSMKCDNGAICVQENQESTSVTCQCPTCSHNFEPVCASDGLFYTNECVLRRESCKEGVKLKIVHSKECGGCSNVPCQFYSYCNITESGEAKCLCPSSCPQEEGIVCGSDGLNYPNECELRLSSCKSKQYITVASKGQCDLCSNVHCKYGAHCEAGLCVCPKDCPTLYEPVCSNDGYTYTNECQLRLSACQRKVDLSVAFFGECQDMDDSQMRISFGSGYIDTCDQSTCRFGGVCDYDAEGIPHCVCSYQCPILEAKEEYVCGSDGRLYEHECKLQEEACRRQQAIEIEPNRSACLETNSLSLPCDGRQPLTDPITGLDLYCGDSPGSINCPINSYCHKDGLTFAKCCPDLAILTDNCSETSHGCCSDGISPAFGLNHAGCPDICNCNKLGSYSSLCDPNTGQCHCKTGVGGLQCDRCKPGFWGLHKISEGNNGCIPCSCNKSGSVRDDCEQMTGRCVCKQGLQGIKCDVCPEGAILLSQGCTHENLTKLYSEPCDQIECKHGSLCEVTIDGNSRCVCSIECSPEEKTSGKICSVDGTTFANECQMKLYGCRMQKTLSILYKGPCKPDSGPGQDSGESYTQGPLRRSTAFKTTNSLIDSLYKTTRQTLATVNGNNNHSSESLGGKTPPSSTPSSVIDEPINIPGFYGNSFIELPRLQAYTRLSIEMEFVTYSESGILLYNGQTITGEGDFVAISIRKGYIEFRYDLGSGIVILRSQEPIKTGHLIRLVAKRYMRDGILSIDGQADVSGSSSGSLKSLDLAENLFIGSIATNRSQVYNNIETRSGFVGCLYRLQVGRHWKLSDLSLFPKSPDIVRMINVIDCINLPCAPVYSTPSSESSLSSSFPESSAAHSSSLQSCQNGGTCLPQISPINGSFSAWCKCQPGYTGDTCQLPVDSFCSNDNNPCIKESTCASLPSGQHFSCFCNTDKSLKLCLHVQRKVENAFVPDFTLTSYLTLPTLQTIAQNFVIEIWFLSRDKEGMLFYNGQDSPNYKGDFISLNIINAQVEFTFNLGSLDPHLSGLVSLKSNKKITLGQWHAVRITRNRKKGTIQLDQENPIYGEAKTNLSELNLDQPLYIGFIPDPSIIHRESNITKGLNGAIQRIVVNGDVWDDLLDRAIEIHNVAKYVGAPCGSPNPCSTNSVCVPQFNDYSCKCNFGDYTMECENIPEA